MNRIGGYFSLELRPGVGYYPDAIELNCGRNALEYILQAKEIKRILVPYYVSKTIYEPLEKLKIEIRHYHIDKDLNPIFSASQEIAEVILYVNYFGIKQETVDVLSKKFKNVITF